MPNIETTVLCEVFAIILLFVGALLTRFGYMGAVAKFHVNEFGPVVRNAHQKAVKPIIKDTADVFSIKDDILCPK